MYIISWSFICTNILIYTYNLYSILCLIFSTLTGDLYIYVEIY